MHAADDSILGLLKRIAGPENLLMDQRYVVLAPNVGASILGVRDNRYALILSPGVQTYYINFGAPATSNMMQISLNANPLVLLYGNIGDALRNELFGISPGGTPVAIWDIFG